MKNKVMAPLLASYCFLSWQLMPGTDSLADDTSWTMFLPAITGSVRTCDTDPQTVIWKGLEWQRCDNGETFNYAGAIDYCNAININRHTDWRLPTKDELKSLVVCTNGHPVPLPDSLWCSEGDYSDNFASPTIDSAFQCHRAGYWSSTVYGGGNAWFVNFYGGNSDLHDMVNNYEYVRCVRNVTQ